MSIGKSADINRDSLDKMIIQQRTVLTMANIMNETASGVTFGTNPNGYDPSQVDSYIATLTDAYQTAYQEYNDVCSKYNNLVEDFKNLKASSLTEMPDARSRMPFNSDALVQRIIDDARAEVVALTANAQAEAKKIMDDARAAAWRVRNTMQKMSDDTSADDAAVRNNVRRLFGDIQMDSPQSYAPSIRAYDLRDHEQVDDILKQSITKIESILSLAAADPVSAQM